MTPTPLYNFISNVAEDFDIPEEELKIIIDYFYKKLKKNLSSLEYVNIEWPGFGTMYCQYYNMKEYLEKLERKLERVKNRVEEGYTNGYINDLINKIERIKAVREMGQKHTAKRINTFYVRKKNYFNKLNNDEINNSDI